MNIKKLAKKLLPDKMVYYYNVLKLIPKFIKAIYIDKKVDYPEVSFFDEVTTVDKIVYEGMSLARFGDGEFLWMLGKSHKSYQNCTEGLKNDLIKSFKNDNDKLLIGIPQGMLESSDCNIYARMHWKIIKANYYSRILEFVNINKVYSNASISRPYIDYKSYKLSTKKFENLKRIWEDKNIVFVEGDKTKLGMGNDLFNNAKTIKRIICPSENAYQKKDEIKNAIVNNISKSTMIIGALGPTASILATELTDLGYQFIDIGHIDIEYMWYKKRCILREKIEGKDVNEAGGDNNVQLYNNNLKYVKSIIEKIL